LEEEDDLDEILGETVKQTDACGNITLFIRRMALTTISFICVCVVQFKKYENDNEGWR
jgi:hypothetical protein